VSISLSFLLGDLGAVWGKTKGDSTRFAAMKVRSVAGAVEPAAAHGAPLDT
jgi:hypothetical protein